MNMKKILSIALSLVMIMALFTGCGSNKNAKTKDNGSYFKEVKKMAAGYIDGGSIDPFLGQYERANASCISWTNIKIIT